MKITVEITKVFTERTDTLKAASNVILRDADGDCFIIKNVRVIEGANGPFMSRQATAILKVSIRRYAIPFPKHSRERMNVAVLTAYEKAKQNGRGARPVCPLLPKKDIC